MFFQQVLHRDLGCASYVIADDGLAVVVDPKWDIGEYLDIAEREQFTIRHVLETHTHADHVSGGGRLAAATGAELHVPNAEAVRFDAGSLRDGDVIVIGCVSITALGTPGHRPDHNAFVVSDTTRSPDPWLVLTGDSVLVGDVARPDLAIHAREGAMALFESVQRILALPDYVELYPAHIGASLCSGTGASDRTASTVGFERRNSELLVIDDRTRFVEALAGDLQLRPPNVAGIVELNSGALIRQEGEVVGLDVNAVQALLRGGAIVVDGRPPDEFCQRHIPGSLNVAMTTSGVATRAARVVEPDCDVVIVARTDGEAGRMIDLLEAVGFLNIRGYLEGGVEAWRTQRQPMSLTPSVGPEAVVPRLKRGELLVLDVRERSDWCAGHIKDSINAPLELLRDSDPGQLFDDSRDRPVVVVCSSGTRSSLAASLLAARGVQSLIHVSGGGITDFGRLGLEFLRCDARA